LPADKSQDS